MSNTRAQFPRRLKKTNKKNISGTNKITAQIAVVNSLIPFDLCDVSIIQSGFGQFLEGSNVGGPLVLGTETKSSPKKLAADSLAHALEGWKYLASAINAMLLHNELQAIHFAYYAELRASISILSSYGMRISYPQSTYLESIGNEKKPSWFNCPTHKLVWKLWNEWINSRAAESLLMDKLRVHPSVTLRNFKDSMATISVSSTLATWGQDLKIDKDHQARNAASYDPQVVQTTFKPMCHEDYEFVRDLWVLAEPTLCGLQFECQLVNWLLKETKNNEKVELNSDWIKKIFSGVERLTGIDANTIGSSISFESNLSPVFANAFSQDVSAKNIISRAFFLLRIANLAIDNALINQPNSHAKGWLSTWLSMQGFVGKLDEISSWDLWADYQDILSNPLPPLPLPEQILNNPNNSHVAMKLARPEVIVAWSLGL